uniref:Uncharacterized protein n=1 Tax=Arundo donax TaxID=35708 RepID=A0A0A9CLR7_ARUDO
MVSYVSSSHVLPKKYINSKSISNT